MDNLTHSLLGAALAKTRLGQASPWAPAALVVAANLPDFENAVLMFCDRPTNMVQHRGITHAVLGVALLIPLFTLLVRGLEQRFARGRPAGSFSALLVGVALAVASHPLLDWLNTYGLRPWLPLADTRYHGDLVFIVDPWLWLLLGAGVGLAGRRARLGSVALAALAVLLTGLVWVYGVSTPLALQIAWPLVLVTLVALRRHGVGRTRPNAVILASLGLAAAYVGFLGWSGRTAWHLSRPVIEAQLPAGETITAHTISPQPADPLRWEIIAETPTAVYRHTFSVTAGPGGAVRLAKRLDDPWVRRAADSREGRAWRHFARHPVAAVVKNGTGRRVYLLDARYGVFPRREFASFAIDVPAPHAALKRADRCASLALRGAVSAADSDAIISAAAQNRR